jgi:voltage-gated potassium channel
MWRQEDDGRIVHVLELPMVLLALLVIPVVLVEESHASASMRSAAAVANWLIWIAFAAELVFVFAVARRKGQALQAHWLELAIVVLTPPFFPRGFSFLRAARILRVLRLLRLGVFGARALRAERVVTSREGFPYLALATIVLVVVSGAGMSLVEAQTFPTVWDGVCWAVGTVTTAGYAATPSTVRGRLVAMVLSVVGIGFVSVLTATIASRFVTGGRERRELLEALRAIERRLAALEER